MSGRPTRCSSVGTVSCATLSAPARLGRGPAALCRRVAVDSSAVAGRCLSVFRDWSDIAAVIHDPYPFAATQARTLAQRGTKASIDRRWYGVCAEAEIVNPKLADNPTQAQRYRRICQHNPSVSLRTSSAFASDCHLSSSHS